MSAAHDFPPGLFHSPFRAAWWLRNPHLPSFVEALTINRLRLGDATVDLALHGRGDDVALRVLRNDGGVRVTGLYC